MKCRATLTEAKLQQKLRVKPNGINAIALAVGKKITQEDMVLKVSKRWNICKTDILRAKWVFTFQNDPFKVKSGGMINMNSLKSRKPQVEDAYDVGIGTQFSAETNKRDEDEEMMKYAIFVLICIQCNLRIPNDKSQYFMVFKFQIHRRGAG